MTSAMQLEELAIKVRRLEETVAAAETAPRLVSDADLMRAVGVVDDITRRVFQTEPRIMPEDDPELNRWFFVVHVVTQAPVAEAVGLNQLWNRKVIDQLGDAALNFRLSLDSQ